MKAKKLFGIIFAIALIVGVFAAITVANAQQCNWTLYVNGQPYSSTASYAVSGQLKYTSNTVYMNHFSGTSIQAIPNGNVGDDDAPVLNIVVTDTCTLTGEKLNNGYYGAIYCEPREGGSGANSRIDFSGTGTLNITKSDNPIVQSISNEKGFCAIEADEVVFGSSLSLNIYANLYGVGASGSPKTVFAIKGNELTSISNSGINNIVISVNTANIPRGGGQISEYKSYANVYAISASKNLRFAGTKGYTYIDITNLNLATSLSGCGCILSSNAKIYDYRYAVYLNAGAAKTGTITDVTSSIKRFSASDGSTTYLAFLPESATSNSTLEKVDYTKIISNPTIYKIGDTKPAATSTYSNVADQCLMKKVVYQVDSVDATTTNDFSLFEDGKYYRYDFRFVPLPGYWISSIASTELTPSTVATNCKLRAVPEKVVYSGSGMGKYSITYYYDNPVITKNPYSVTSDARGEATFTVTTTGRNLTYQWKRYKDGTTRSAGTSAMGVNTNTFKLDPKTDGENAALCTMNGWSFFCEVSTDFGTTTSSKALLTVSHLAKGEYTEDGDVHSATCYCGVKISADHIMGTSFEVVKDADCTEEGTFKYTCTVCGASIYEAQPAEGHSFYLHKTQKATFTAYGKDYDQCEVCTATKTTKTYYKVSTVALSKTSYTYNTKVQKPSVTVKDSKGNALKKDTDYTVKYSNSSSTKAGTYKVTVTLKGKYSGTKELSYKIVQNAVTGVKTSSVKATTLVLTWTKFSGAKYYKVEKYNASKKTWSAVSTVSTNTITISKLSAGTKYQFRVTALNADKKALSKVSSTLTTYTLTVAPTVTLTSSKSKTATASWKKVTGATKYDVYKSTDGKNWTKVKTTTSTSYTITGLTGGKKVYVKVYAYNAGSAKSAASSVKTVTVKK